MHERHTTDRDRVWAAAYNLFEKHPYLMLDDFIDLADIYDIDRDTVQSALNAMVEQGFIEGGGPYREDGYTESKRSTPGECNHCGQPLDEGGWHRVESYDPYNRRFDGSEHLCGDCLHDR